MSRIAKPIALAAFAVTLAGGLSACSSTPSAPVSEPVVLENTTWMLPLTEKSDCDTPPVIEFLPGNRLAGDLGCNRAMGSFQFDGTNILFDKVAATKRMCGQAFMKLENEMLRILSEARTVRRTDKGLEFYDGNGKLLNTLVPEEAGACY